MKSTTILLALLIAGLLCWPVMAADVPVTNGDFEAWTVNGAGGPPDNWTNDDGAFTSTQEATTIHGGTYSVNLTWTSQSNQDFVSDLIAVTAGELYTATAWVYDNDIAGQIRLCFEWYDATPTYLAASYGGYSSDCDGWQKMSYSANANASAAYCKILIRQYDISANWDGNATVYMDDVTLFEGTPGAASYSIYDLNYPYADCGACYSGTHDGEGNVTTWGIITGILGSGFALQETEHATHAGIWGYAGSYDISTFAVGDTVTVTGEIEEYYGLTEIMNITDVTLVASGATVTPVAVTGADLSIACDAADEPYENMLVTVSNVTIDSADGYGDWYAHDATRGVFFVGNALLNPLPVDVGQEYLSITGVSKYEFDAYRISPRDANDFEAAPVIPTLSEWGLIILALLLLAAGTVAIIRKRSLAAAGETK